MKGRDVFRVSHTCEVRAQNAGIFMSRGVGMHPERVITSYELIFVERGVLGIFEGKDRYKVKAGESLILYPGIRHGGTQPYEPDLQYYWLHFDIVDTGISFSPQEAIVVKRYTSVARPTRLVQLFRWFINDQEDGILSPETASLLIFLMVAEIELSESVLPRKGQEIPYLVRQASIIIKTRFNEQITTSSISEELQCNSDYLGRIYHKIFHTTITKSIHNQRIRHARGLLLGSTMNISAVAYACGFNDVGYFRLVFRKQTGVSPNEFRQSYSKIHVNTE